MFALAANPTKKMKDEWQAEAKANYGLSPDQLAEVEAQLEELVASVDRSKGSGLASGHVPLIDLMGEPYSTSRKFHRPESPGSLTSKSATCMARARTRRPCAAAGHTYSSLHAFILASFAPHSLSQSA